MDFSLSPQQEQLRETILRFARKELNADLIERDREATFPRELWRRCAELGLCALPFPEEHGGSGYDLLSTAIAVEALAYACHDAGLVHAILAQIVSGRALQLFGSPELRQRHLPSLCAGEVIVAQAATEADAGSDVFSMRTRAVQDGDDWVIDGTKMFITNGPVADLVLVVAVTNPARKSFGGHSMFLVERDRPGFSAGSAFSKMGLRTLQNSELIFDGCRVPASNMVGKPGQGSVIFTEVMRWERVVFGACHLGSLQRILEACISYARQREQFGQPIGKNQAVSSKIVRMKMNLELGRLMVYKAATMEQQGKRAMLEASTIKIFASESLRSAALDAVQIFGASGYMTETQIERELRDSIAGTIYSGTVELNTVIIGKLLGL
jgi:alkylation response protein AidB-like acyl-CoA dehydrogenase